MSALKSRKARAILAGGVVLGVGASMTLAAWADSEWASGTFGTGGVTFQGALDGDTFSDHATPDTAAALTFELNASDLTPGASVEATYWVKAEGQDANVVINPAQISADADEELVDAPTVEFSNGDECTGNAIGTGALGAAGVTTSRTAVDGVALATCIRVTLDE